MSSLPEVICSIPGCPVEAYTDVCRRHYDQRRVAARRAVYHQNKIYASCEFIGCLNPVRHGNSRTCETHKYQCDVSGCVRLAKDAKGRPRVHCPMHASRLHTKGSVGSLTGRISKIADGIWSEWRTNTDGYVWRYMRMDGKRIYQNQHRYIMETILGRPLKKSENVHHKNLIRSDNRPENLELWTTAQPTGARVEDMIEWCEWFLSEYKK